MRSLRALPHYDSTPRVARALFVMLLAVAGSVLPAGAQFSAHVPTSAGDVRIVPENTYPFSFRTPEAGASSVFGMGNPPKWKQTFADPFRPNADLGTFTPLMSSNGLHYGGSGTLGLTPRGAESFGAVAPTRNGGLDLSGPLFSAELPGHPTAGANTPFGTPVRSVPSLNDLLRGNHGARPASPFALQRPAQGLFPLAGGFDDAGQPSNASLFITSDLGNGVLFSAGAGGGGHSMVGAPAAGLSSSTGPKRSNPAVNLKLSF